MVRTTLRPTNQPSSNGATAPVTPNRSPVSIGGPTQRKPSWVLLGALLVGLAALLGAWVFMATSDQMSIMVAARDIDPGEVIQAADLRVVEVGRSSEMRAVQSDQQSLVIGLAARGPIPAGTVVNTDLFGEAGLVIPSGSVVVGASLEPGAAPVAGLRAGDRVDLLATQRTTAGPTADASPATASLLTSGTVWSVEPASAASASAKLWVAIVVPASAQGAVAQAAADGLLRLSLVGAGE
jgi:hypothetical protein